MKVSDVVADFLIHNGINTVFGIIGSANSHLYDSFVKSGIHIYNVHHEQCAVMAAGAYYQTCGKLAVALVTAGGGATNSVTGIVSLWADSVPAIILSGQESSNYVRDHCDRRMYGTQGLDIVHMVSKVTKYSKVLDAGSVQDELEKALFVSTAGRKGPVLLDVPFDVQSKDTQVRLWNECVHNLKSPTEDEINTIKKLLGESKRPVILGGYGISNYKKEFDFFLKSVRAPVLLTWSAIDVMDHEHPLFFGSAGVYGQRAANFILQKCDLLLVIGSRLTLPQTGYDMKEFARGAKVVMVDIDPSEFKEFVDTRVHSDCGEFLRKMQVSYKNETWMSECLTIKKEFPLVDYFHTDTEFPNSYKIVHAISEHLKPDQVIVTDMGTALLSGHQVIRLKEGHTMFSSYGLGEMGYGLPAAFGAAIAGNGREVLCLNCDGSMMMNLQELQTIVQHKLRVKIVVFNNDGYLMIKHTQKMLFKGEYTAVNSSTGIVLPDYMKIAEAFGYEKFQIKNWEEFNFYFRRFMDFEGPSICEIFMPPEQEFIPKVKGVVKNDGSIFAPPLEEMSPVLPFATIERIMGSYISSKSTEIVR
jgi:acetolactate synthase-1/2/3 large subunit